MADAVMINGSDSLDLPSLLSSSKRDFVIRNNGDQVKIDSLKGKKLGLYFSAHWCPPCQRFTPVLAEVYQQISPNGDFEIVFVSADQDEAAFNGYFSDMPWLAIPFSDSETRDRLDELFKVNGIPHLVIVDESGRVVTKDGVEIVQLYGVEGYPFSVERIKEIKDQEVEAKRNQSLKSILVSSTREFVISSGGEEVPVSELEGKTVGLYFSLSSLSSCAAFVPMLVDVYNKLKANGENIEIVLIPLDEEEESFKQSFGTMPWLSLPFKDKSCEKLVRYFELSTLPTLVIIGPDGKTLCSNAADAVENHGTLAYPFTPEKFAELAEIEKAKAESQTLESVLVSGDRDFVFGKGEARIKVSDLAGKTILLYFSAHWCPPCRAFLPMLIEAYHKIKAKDDSFEVIFISSDRDQSSFDEFFGEMPWLTLPFGDNRKTSLSRLFKVQGIPMLVALGPTGKTLTRDARKLVMLHGANAYPFSEERLKEIEIEYEDMAKDWPKKLKHKLHEAHELALTRRPVYRCNGCEESGQVWSFYCDQCDFDLHTKCALEEGKENEEAKEEEVKEGFVCDGDVCRKV
jgi:nucleoredoxin